MIKWIRLDSKLPELNKDVLICNIKKKFMEVATFKKCKNIMEDSYYWQLSNSDEQFDFATHWASLPEYPKKEEKQK